jgi:hypothetical protein
MYSQKDLDLEITKLIDAAIDHGEIVAARWLTQTILAEHSAIEGDDTPFYNLCAYEHVRESVRKVTRRYKTELRTDADMQIVMEGFERLQVAYSVDQDGDQFIVPTVRCTRSQMVAKSRELQRMMDGCAQHLREMLRYIEQRDAAGDWPPEDDDPPTRWRPSHDGPRPSPAS